MSFPIANMISSLNTSVLEPMCHSRIVRTYIDQEEDYQSTLPNFLILIKDLYT